MAPLWTKCFVHIKPQSQPSWGLKALDTFYISPAKHHYQCYQTIIPAIDAEHISDTVTFQYHGIQTPHVSPTDCIVQAAQNLEQALKDFLPSINDTMEAIQTLHTLVLTCTQVPNADLSPALILPPPAARPDPLDRPIVLPTHSLPTPPVSTPVTAAPQWYNFQTHKPNVNFQYSQLVQSNQPYNPLTPFV